MIEGLPIQKLPLRFGSDSQPVDVFFYTDTEKYLSYLFKKNMQIGCPPSRRIREKREERS